VYDYFDEFSDMIDASDTWCGLYNPGDKPSDFLLICFDIKPNGSISIGNKSPLIWKGLELKGDDKGVLFNSKNGLLQGIVGDQDNYSTTSNIYNEYITEGTFL
jgi:hypothetical protein